ncbi:hypothetical protein ACA910_021302 [Epithemia clementina (nom. ined.)]
MARSYHLQLSLWALHLLGSWAFFPPGSRTIQQTFSSVVSSSASSSSSSSSSSASPTQLHAYKKIFVAGGSKGVGRQIVHQILGKNDGTAVVALVRDPEVAADLNSLSTETAPITAIVGNAMDQKTVENAMDGCDAAISTLGGGTSANDQGQRVDYTGNSNVIESAGILGVTRIVLVTTIGCGDSRGAITEPVYETLKGAIDAKNKAENLLIKYYTNSNWTIIRPGGLKSEPMTGRAVLTADPTVLGLIHREDVARLVLQALHSPKTERQILSAIDPTIESTYASDKPIEPFEL